MHTKSFSRESRSWSSFFSSSDEDIQRTMTICAAHLLGGDLGHGHRLFLAQCLNPRAHPLALQPEEKRGAKLVGGVRRLLIRGKNNQKGRETLCRDTFVGRHISTRLWCLPGLKQQTWKEVSKINIKEMQ